MNGESSGTSMEGYKIASSQAQSYDEFDLDSSADNPHEVTNLEDEPVAKILLPALNQKKPSTIKINLQNPSFSRKSTPDLGKQKPGSPEVLELISEPLQIIPIPLPEEKVLPFFLS